MILDEDEIQEMNKSSVTVRQRGGTALAKIPSPKQEEPAINALLKVLRQMSSAIEAAVAARVEPATISVEAPKITVEAPNVTVEHSAQKPVLQWEGEVTSRDNSGRMKKFTIRAIT